MSILQDVRRSVSEMSRLERRGVLASQRVSAKLRAKLLWHYTRGETFNSFEFLAREMLDTLRDSMVATHLVGLKREREILERRLREEVKFSVFDKVLATLKRQLEVDIKGLELQYNTQALSVLRGASDKIDTELRTTVNELIGTGAHVAEAKKVLHKRFADLGLTPTAGYRLESIYRTQTQIAFNAGKWEADKDPVVQEILWGYTYSAVGDDRTRENHAKLDGTSLPKEHPLWRTIWPPNGWNCRCVVIPIFDRAAVKSPPRDVVPDKGFEFNPGEVFST